MGSYSRFTLHRKFRRWRRDAKLWRSWSVNYLNRHIFGSWQKLGKFRWVFASWVFIVLISLWGLVAQIQGLGEINRISSPVKGGIYREAILGQVKSVNPLYPDNSATEDITSLVFSGLTKINGSRELVPDLAEKWEISADRKIYTFYLKPNLSWQDGTKLTTKDIAFTISRVQNPDTRSPYAVNWNGVKYEVIDDNTIKFNLPTSYGNFLVNTTLGILPIHILESVKPANLRSYEFNQRPVGSGPYKLDLLEVDSTVINLVANDKYYVHEPHIPKIRIVLFQSSQEMQDALTRKQVDAISSVPPGDVATIAKIEGVNNYKLGLPAYVGAFFNLRSPALANPDLRKALAYATNRQAIIDNILHGEAAQAYYPIPAGYSGFNPSALKYETNETKAQDYFNKSAVSKTNLRMVTLNNSVYENVANALADSWRKLGLNIEVITASSVELQQNYIRSRNYDILLYGQNLGLDSDVYSFWHSSQVDDPGLNISAYKNPEVDKLLESGRLAKDSDYKATRYSSFVEAWAKDVPAVIIYSPYYNYVQSDAVKGFDAKKVLEPSNRFYNIYDWYFTNL